MNKWKTVLATAAAAGVLLAGAVGNGSQTLAKTTESPIKLGVITTLTGPLGPYGVEWMRGFRIGLQYATRGTDQVDGHALQVIVDDDGGNPDTAVQEAKQLLQDTHVNILAGLVNSASAIAVEPFAERYRTLLMIGPAVADEITGADYNPFVFKVSPNSFMESKAAVDAIGKKNATVAQLAPNYSFGWDSVSSFKTLATAAGMKDIIDVYADPTATDFTPQLEKIISMHPQYLYVTWAGAPGPWKAIAQMKLQQQGIQVVTGIPNIAAIQALFQGDAGMRGYTTYYYTLPHNAVNNYLISHDKSEYQTVPDLFDPDGMAAAIALVDGLVKTHGNPSGVALKGVLSGLSFAGPTGTFTFRPQDHQALQNLYAVVLKDEKGVDYPVPVLTKVLPAQSLVPPILNHGK
ncbi:MAG: substrate-binding domain-containing protein [Firmicutes bacterium]|nr:substrate-binding domain-containing protein [Bacillota bacterium]